MSTKIVNGIEVALTPEEQADFDAREAAHRIYVQSAEFLSLTMRKARREEYPSIGDQLDALYKAMDAGTLNKVPEFYDPIKIVKDKYPLVTNNVK